MKRSKTILWVVFALVAGFLIWRIVLHTPKPSSMGSDVKTPVVAEPNKVGSSGDINEPSKLADANQPRDTRRRPRRREWGESGGFGEFGGFEGRRGPRRRADEIAADANDPNRPGDSNEPMEALNLKNVEMKDIIQKISEWTGKTVIPTDEAMQQKITIYAPKKLPRNQALSHIYAALRMKGFIAEHTDDAIYIAAIKDSKLRFVPTIEADQPLATLENKNQIVQKFFKLENYSPAQMGQVIQPLVGEYGHVSADETTGTLLVIDTVENLIRIERIIKEFDVPEAEQTVTKIIPVQYGDPSEIVQMLKMLLGESEGYSSIRSRNYGRRYGGDSNPSSSPGPSERSSSSQKGDSGSGAATSVVVGSTRGPIVLIPEPRRKWIIARASAEDVKQIEEWIKKLDKEEPVESEYEVIQLRYADPQEVEDSVGNGFRDLPGTEFLPSVLVEPLPNTKQVIIFGRKDLREIVKKIIQEIDVPPGQFETRHFKLKYADPDQVKENIEGLYEEGLYGGDTYSRYGRYSPWGSSRSRSSTTSSETVKVISYVSLKQVTVIASPENMEKISGQIMEWDVPIDVNEVKPRIIELHNSDPIEMADLLRTLFSESTSSGRVSIYDILFGRTEDKQKIVGPLYGQLTFEAVPGTKKIIVISKIPEAYTVIEQLILELDKKEMAEVPKVMTIKYADPEDLAQRLNALFNELGTTATISFSERGLSEAKQDETGTSSSSSSSSSSSGGSSIGSSTSQSEYRPWWNTGRQSTEEMPISNVIGRVRFIPDTHSKSILVLAPPEFMDRIDELIKELDIPGKQVMIKAVIVQVDHSSMTSLGVQLSSDESKWATLDNENAITALTTLSHLTERGSLTLEAGASVTALIDFLVRELDAKILNQQTLWTKDNEEAEFFKGQIVAFQTEVSVSDTGGRATSQYEYEQVGMTLKARPNITPEKNVDMIIRVILSQLASEEINNQRVRTAMDTTTNMIVQDGQTMMLGGILFQKASNVVRKLPLLGDVPLVGGLFRHNETITSNNEMLIFITPYVIDEPKNMLPATIEEMERPKKTMEEVKKQLEATIGDMEQKTND